MSKKPLSIALLATLCLALTGCADDNLAKGVLVAGGAAGGAFIGRKIADPGNKTMGMVLGAGAGGVLGYLLGGSIGKK